MKILVNAATAVVGGGAQVAASFILNTMNAPYGHDFIYAVSPLVAEQIKNLIDELPIKTVVITPSPAKIWYGRKSRDILCNMVETFVPDVVYSIASPSYVDFKKTTELARFTDPWFTHPNKLAFSTIPAYKTLHLYLKTLYKGWSLRRLSYFHTQSETAAQGLIKRLKLKPKNVRVIPNSQNQLFNEVDQDFAFPTGKSGVTLALVLAHPYPHKNLELVPYVAEALKKLGKTIKFIMTIPENNSRAKKILATADKLTVRDMIQPVGKLNLRECKKWYSICDIVFLPTLLETFTATYLEAMAMQRPIVTTDLDFARGICAGAAEYFEPLNATAAAMALLRVIDEPNRYAQLITNGTERLQEFPNNGEQYKLQIEWLEEVVRRELKVSRKAP